jgi:protein O-mannosyl-transferase
MTPSDEQFSFKIFFIPLTNTKAIVFIIIIGLVVFSNMLLNAFVADDITLILLNPTVQSLQNIPALLFQSNTNTTGVGLFTGTYYIPLTTISFAFLYSLFGAAPFFFHAFQLSMHVANAIIIFLLFESFFSRKLSFFLSLVFLVHPINQETVSYIADLQDILYFFFGALALVVYKKTKIITTKSVFYISFFLLLSLLAKITGILFLAIIIFDSILQKNSKRKQLYLGICITLIIYFLMKHFAVSTPFQVGTSLLGTSDIFVRLLTTPKVIYHYIATFFFPHNLITHQEWIVKLQTFTDFYFPLLIDFIFFVSVFGLGIFCYKKSKKILQTFLFFFFWFFIGFLLHIQIIPLDFTVADRWFYFPIVGLLGLLGVFISQIKINIKFLTFIGAILIIVLSLRTMTRNTDWRNGYSLYSHDVLLQKDNAYLNGLLGNELMDQGKYDESIQFFSLAAKYNPTQWKNYINIGAAYYSKVDINNAEKYFREAINHGKPQMGYERLAKLYLLENKKAKAKKVLQEGITIYPNDAVLIQLNELTHGK